MHHIIVYAFVIVILSCPTIQNLLHYSRMMGSSDAPSCIIFHSWVFCELCHLGQHSKLVLVFLLWNNNFCSVFPPICSLSSSSFWICVDLDCFGLLSGPWMHVQPSDSVVYAVINRGSCHWICVCSCIACLGSDRGVRHNVCICMNSVLILQHGVLHVDSKHHFETCGKSHWRVPSNHFPCFKKIFLSLIGFISALTAYLQPDTCKEIQLSRSRNQALTDITLSFGVI